MGHTLDMEAPWPLVGREEELERIAALVSRGAGGLVIAGEPGVGRSRMGAEALSIAEDQGAAVARIAGTGALSTIPLGVFAPLLPAEAFAPAPGADARPQMLRTCREALAAMAGAGRLVLLVDDAHLVDEVSASLFQQLIPTESVFVIACVDTGADLPEPIVGLWKDDAVERIDLGGLDIPSITTLMESVLGGPVDPAAVRAVAHAAQGSLVFLRELVRSAMEAGAFSDDIGVWRLVAPLPSSKRMAELVQARLEGLTDAERDVLELIAFGEPLTVGEIPNVDLSTLEGLERRALVSVRADGLRTEVRLAHAVYGQVVRDRMPMLRARQIARSLGDAVEATGMRRRDDLLRVATWRLEGGGSRPDLMFDAALAARDRYDFALAERFARRALHLGDSFDAALLAAGLAGHQGRREEAEAELSALADRATTDRERGLVAAARLDNLVFALGRLDRGLEVALEAEAAITDPTWRAEVTAKRASVVGGIEGPGAAAELAGSVLEAAEGRALVWACIVRSYGLGRRGQPAQARVVIDRGREAHRALDGSPGWYPWRLDFFDAEALAYLGRLDEASDLAETMYGDAVDEGSLEGQAWAAWRLTRSVSDRGHATTAAKYGRLAVALFRQVGSPQLEQFALTDLATAFAIRGFQRESRETLEFMGRLGLSESRYCGVDVVQARAWTDVAHGDLPSAIRHFDEGGRIGQKIGDLMGAASCLHGAARLGSPRTVEPRLEELAASIDSPLVQARLDHVRALVSKDARDLVAVSTRFGEMGAHLLAAEAQADAALAWQSAGEARRATAASRRATHLARECESPATPAIASISTTSRLTPAERQAALLAANGRTSRQIAEELVVSVRTVENHLQHAYEKLGIRGRRELRELFESAGTIS